MTEISIGRLSLALTGVDPHFAQRLADGMADKLADARLTGAGDKRQAIAVRLPGIADESEDALAARIVAEIVRQLDRRA